MSWFFCKPMKDIKFELLAQRRKGWSEIVFGVDDLANNIQHSGGFERFKINSARRSLMITSYRRSGKLPLHREIVLCSTERAVCPLILKHKKDKAVCVTCKSAERDNRYAKVVQSLHFVHWMGGLGGKQEPGRGDPRSLGEDDLSLEC